MGNPTFHASIIRTVAESAYEIDDATVADLVSKAVKAGVVSGVLNENYFGVLVTRARRALGTATVTVESQLEAIETANKPLQGIVNSSVAAVVEARTDLAKDERARERNRLSGFARSAVSVLRRWVKAGGDLSALEVGAYKKSRFEREAAEHEKAAAGEAGENTPEAKVAKRLASLITALNQLDASHRAGYVEYCRDQLTRGVK